MCEAFIISERREKMSSELFGDLASLVERLTIGRNIFEGSSGSEIEIVISNCR